MAVTKRTHYEVLRRDNHTCRYCGGKAPDVALTVDHVMPVALGGSDSPENLVAACRDCNAGKASTTPDGPLVADVSQDALRYAAARAEAHRRWLARQEDVERYVEFLMDEFRSSIFEPDDEAEDTFRQWHRMGIPVELPTEAIQVTARARHVHFNGVWRYFCGVTWNLIKALDAETSQIYEEANRDGT